MRLPRSRADLTALTYALGPNAYYQPAYARIAQHLDLHQGALLDVGCGPGGVCFAVAQDKPEVDCVGVDINPAMIQRAQAAKGGRLGCTFHVMDASALRYPAATFDRIVAVQTMHHWRDPDGIIAELARVLKPTGWGVLLDADPSATVSPDWVRRRGPWPPDRWVRRNWSRFSLGAPGLDQMTERLQSRGLTVERYGLGFYVALRFSVSP